MAGLLTPEERAAAVSVRFSPRQPGPMAPGPSEYRVSLSYSSIGLLLLPIFDRPSDEPPGQKSPPYHAAKA